MALFLAILPHVPGFLVQVEILPPETVSSFFRALYNYSWFSGFGIAFVLHLLFRRMAGPHRPE